MAAAYSYFARDHAWAKVDRQPKPALGECTTQGCVPALRLRQEMVMVRPRTGKDAMSAVNADERLIALLADMIRIPSVCPSDGGPGERAFAEFVARELGARGFSIEWQMCADGRPNLIATFGPATPKKTVAFEFHLDTVGTEGMTTPPFEPTMHGGRLFGRGACDDKGPAAALLYALTPEVLAGLRGRGVRLMILGAMGEEKGNVGAEGLVERGVRADQMIVLEPTELAIIHAHKGALWFRVEVHGRAAHGAVPEEGINAICAMMSVVDYLLEETATAAAARENPVLGKPTVNVGRIQGGTGINIVPKRCFIEVDRRLLPEEDGSLMIEQLKSELRRMKEDGEIVDGAVQIQKLGAPFMTTTDSELVRLLASSCAACGVGPEVKGAAWYSDAGALSRVCREIVVFGPGSILQAHTAEEYIELSELQRGADILRDILVRL